jgi:BspA type Leucine rich repeat region (6 copies)
VKFQIKNLLTAMLLLALPAVVQAENGPFYYSVSGNTATITNYSLPGGDVVIPSVIDGYTVVAIGDFAFSGYSITSVTIPDSVTSIGNSAFWNCFNLSNVAFGNGVIVIGNGAFLDCYSLTNVAIPNNVVNILTGAFKLCTKLANVSIGNNVTYLGGETFANCYNLANVTIGTKVTSIQQETFSYCSNLTTVTIPNSVTNIGAYAFAYCSRLPSVTIPSSVTNIDTYAFEWCYSLLSLNLPNSVASIGDQAFYFCQNLAGVTFGNNLISIGSDAFYGCSLTNVTIPSSVTNLGQNAFIEYFSLTNIGVNVSNPVFSSLNGVLFDKAQKTLVEFPDGLGGSYTIPNNVTTIDAGAFDDCINLTSVVIPKSVTNILFQPFYGCPSLNSAYFMGNAPFDNGSAFYGDKNTVYYLPGTTGWGSTFGTAPAVLWNPQAQTGNGNVGIKNGRFGFNLTGPTNATIVVEASTNLSTWVPVSTNAFSSSGTSSFSDPQWTNYPVRYYRLRSP